jgi:transcription elongation factor S-II
MSPSLKTVRSLKEDLLKITARPPGEGHTEKILDILTRLDGASIDLGILSETLIGATVAKLKNHESDNVSAKAKELVKKWKAVAKSAQSKPSSANASAANSSTSSAGESKLKRLDSTNSAEINPETEWSHLPPLRSNICKKLHTIFLMSQSSLADLNESAIRQLCLSRADEVESSIDTYSRGDKNKYTEKVRSLAFNLKKNGPLRNNVLLGTITPSSLVYMTSEELQTEEKQKATSETVKFLQDSRRLDWEQANEDKINNQCGIKGDLKNASLFTCGRCKSTKTTSTQKQTRSADEPMTVFVLCLNCGKRWKC